MESHKSHKSKCSSDTTAADGVCLCKKKEMGRKILEDLDHDCVGSRQIGSRFE